MTPEPAQRLPKQMKLSKKKKEINKFNQADDVVRNECCVSRRGGGSSPGSGSSTMNFSKLSQRGEGSEAPVSAVSLKPLGGCPSHFTDNHADLQNYSFHTFWSNHILI